MFGHYLNLIFLKNYIIYTRKKTQYLLFMNQQQHQKQQQKQGYYMSQQHLKLMHIMHLSGYALQEYIANEVELNPVLEMEKESETEQEISECEDTFDSEIIWDTDDDSFDKYYKQNNSSDDYYEAPVVQYYSLQENQQPINASWAKRRIQQWNLY